MEQQFDSRRAQYRDWRGRLPTHYNSRHEQGSPGGVLQPWNLYAQFQLHEKIKPTQKLWGGKMGREVQLLMETREPERKFTGSTVYSP